MNTAPEGRKSYSSILAQAARLDRQTQMELLVDLAAQLRQTEEVPNHHKRGLGTLQGFFKGAWDGRDAQDYVNQERDSWDG